MFGNVPEAPGTAWVTPGGTRLCAQPADQL